MNYVDSITQLCITRIIGFSNDKCFVIRYSNIL